jgi:hypothetical protein
LLDASGLPLADAAGTEFDIFSFIGRARSLRRRATTIARFSAPASTSVPKPASFALLDMGVFGLMRRQRD